MNIQSFALLNISSEIALLLTNRIGIIKLQSAIVQFQQFVRIEAMQWLDQHSVATLPYLRIEQVIDGMRCVAVMSYAPVANELYYSISICCANEDESKARWSVYVL